MRIFRSELAQNYNTYSFGYSIYAEREKGDKLHNIYEKGFLPYSGKTGIKNYLYMSRSLRVDSKKFKPNSENRRILRKFDNEFERTVIPIEKFNTKNEKFLSFCKTYFKEWHGIDIKGKLQNILGSGFITDVAIYTKDNKIMAYVLLPQDKKMSHYWFSFYDLSLIRQSFGMWLMINEVLESQKLNHEYIYLGTGYGKKAKYKMNFDFLEYWNGSKWIKDKKKLKTRALSDEIREIHFSNEWSNQ